MPRYPALRDLALPAAAAAVAAVVVLVPFVIPLPFIGRPRAVDAVLVGAVVFFFLLALANHLSMRRLAAQLGERLAGLDDFDTDLRRRLARLEDRLESRLAETPIQPAPLPPAAPAATLQAEGGEANVIRFETRQRAPAGEVEDIAAEPAGKPAMARPTGARLADALERDLIQAWFQPIVTLPGRQTRFLEASPHLLARTGAQAETGRPVDPGYANAPEIDRRMLLQSLTLQRELDRSGKGLGVIWTVHAPLLADAAAFSAVERMLETNAALAGQLVVRIGHADFTGLEAGQTDRLHRIRDLGYRLALGDCPTAPSETASIARGLFAIRIMDATRLVAQWLEKDVRRPAADDDATEIIACRVGSEELAMVLIDHDVLLAQGNFFSPPRPLRSNDPSRQTAEH